MHAEVAELVDAPDLGSGGLGCMGSSPFLRTIFFSVDNLYSFEFDGVGTYVFAGNIDALNNQSSFSVGRWETHRNSSNAL